MTFQMYFGAGNTTVSTTLLVCFTASFQIPSTALATSPFAARAEVLQKCSQEQQCQQKHHNFLCFKRFPPCSDVRKAASERAFDFCFFGAIFTGPARAGRGWR